MKTLDVIIWLILFFFAATMVSDLGCSQHKIDELHLVRDLDLLYAPSSSSDDMKQLV
jgi:hypothetical protein